MRSSVLEGGSGNLDRELGSERLNTHTQSANHCGHSSPALPRLLEDTDGPGEGKESGHLSTSCALALGGPHLWADREERVRKGLRARGHLFGVRGRRDGGSPGAGAPTTQVRGRGHSSGVLVVETVLPRWSVPGRTGHVQAFTSRESSGPPTVLSPSARCLPGPRPPWLAQP